MTRVRRALSSLAVLAGLGALLAGCGGGGGDSTSSAADWASGYCGAATSWVTTLDEARASVKTGTTPEEAAQQVTDETNTFTQAIGGFGAPDTPDGSTSAATAKSLSQLLSGRVARISAAIDTNNPDVTVAARTKIVQDQVAASLTDVTDTTAKLAADDAELGTAMGAATECADLKTALEKSAA